jgi:hypothetical protein
VPFSPAVKIGAGSSPSMAGSGALRGGIEANTASLGRASPVKTPPKSPISSTRFRENPKKGGRGNTDMRQGLRSNVRVGRSWLISYNDRMSKTAVSVTLAPDNLLWLEGQTLARRSRSLSATLDQVLAEARKAGHGRPVRSVVGTVRIDESDPQLHQADTAVRALFRVSLGKPRSRQPGNKAGRRRG